MTSSATGTRQSSTTGPLPSRNDRPLAITGAIAACAAAGAGLVVLIMLVLAGWIAAPHAGVGLTGVLRTAGLLWLIGHHVGFALPSAGRIGMLPLGVRPTRTPTFSSASFLACAVPADPEMIAPA